MLPVKKSGVGLHNPVTSASDKYNSFLRTSYKLIGAVKGDMDFSNDGRICQIKEERQDGKKYRDVANDAKLRVIVGNQGAFEKIISLQAKHTG